MDLADNSSHAPAVARKSWLAMGPSAPVCILSYHGLVEEKTDPVLERNFHTIREFRGHVAVLKRLSVLALAQLEDQYYSRWAPHYLPAVVITFDDGYANNLIAAEILREAHLPFTIFISTGTMSRLQTIWTVELSLLLLHGHATRVTLLDRAFPLGTREERLLMFQGVRKELKRLPADRRRAEFDHLRQQFPSGETERLLARFPAFGMMTPGEMRQLADAGVTIGSHGVWHEIHHPHQERKVTQRELSQSRQVLEMHLGRPCRSFAFPNGDYNADSVADLQTAGYRIACTTQQGKATDEHNPLLLPRLEPPASLYKFIRRVAFPSAARGAGAQLSAR